MLIPIFQNGLKAYILADQHGGSTGASVTTAEDQSAFNRDATAAAPAPTLKTNAVGGKKSFVFNGSANPLKYTGELKINCGFVVCKINGNFTNYNGLLSGLTDHPILEGLTNTNVFYDNTEYRLNGKNLFEYRLNNRIYSSTKTWVAGDVREYHTPPAPVGEWGIIFFRFWQPVTLNGFQIGQDRDYADRKLSGEVALLALYDRWFCPEDIDKQFKSLSYHFQIPIALTFPYAGSRGDVRAPVKRVISDNQPRAITREKVGTLNRFQANFGAARSMKEVEVADAFINYAYPGKTFLYLNGNTLPWTHTPVEFPEGTAPKFAEDKNNSAYQLEFVQSLRAPEYFTPLYPPVIEGAVTEIIDTTPPSTVTTPTAIAASGSQINTTWTPATDDSGLIKGYVIERDVVSTFNSGNSNYQSITRNSPATAYSFTGLISGTNYFFRIKAFDYAGNFSTAWSGVATAQTFVVAIPPAPTAPVTDDDNNTFGFTLAAGYVLADHEYSLNGGATWANVLANPFSVGNVAYAPGVVQVRVKAATDRAAGPALSNAVAFTVPGNITPPAPTNPVTDDASNLFGFTPATGYATTDHEYSLNAGASWSMVMTNPFSVGDAAFAAGQVKVRVKAATGRNAGPALSNTDAFTATSTPPEAITEADGTVLTESDGTILTET